MTSSKPTQQFSYRDEEALVRYLVGDLERKLAGRHESRILRIIPSDHCHLGVLGPRDPLVVQPDPLEPGDDDPAPLTQTAKKSAEATGDAPQNEDEEPSETAPNEAEQITAERQGVTRDSTRRPPSSLGFEIVVSPPSNGEIELILQPRFAIYTQHFPTFEEQRDELGRVQQHQMNPNQAAQPRQNVSLLEIFERRQVEVPPITLRINLQQRTERIDDDGAVQRALDAVLVEAATSETIARMIAGNAVVPVQALSDANTFQNFLRGVATGPVLLPPLQASLDIRSSTLSDGSVRVSCYICNNTPRNVAQRFSRLLKKAKSLQRSGTERVQWHMRGTDHQQNHVFSYISPEQRVRHDHPLRPIRTMVNEILKQLSPQFNKMYAKGGRPSIPPEQLLRAQLLQMLYSVRSERLLMEEMDYNILFRWFVGLNLDDPVWDSTVFTKNRDRLLEAEMAKEFLARVVARARERGWTSDEHFTVDGTLLEAWASVKSFQPKDQKSGPPPDDPGNPTVDFRGEQRSNQTHESKSDPDALLARKGAGKEAKLSYSGNLLVENRNGLIVSSTVWEATGTAERLAAMAMLQEVPGTGRVTVGGDKGFDTADFVRECRNMCITPHVAQNLARRGGSAIDGRTTQQVGYRVSQKKRKRIEECFGWLKTIALLRKVRHRGTLKVDWMFTFACAAYNLVRLRNLMAATVPAQ